VRKTTTTRLLALLAAAGLAVPASACAEKGVSKPEYLRRARAVCEKGRQTLEEASHATFGNLAPGQKVPDSELERFVRQTVIPTLRDQVRQLRALPPPKGKKGKVEEIYGALDKGLDELDKGPQRLIDGSNPFRKAELLAGKYGIGVCAGTT
jgi:hypothetical protein